MAWKVKTTENLLKSLLMNNMDTIAVEYTNFYIEKANKVLLLFCIDNNNELFLKNTLQSQIFTQHLSKSDIINYILGKLEHGTNTEMLLNVLLYTDW